MSYQISQGVVKEINTAQLLIGQTLDYNEIRIYFSIVLNSNLNEQLQDLSNPKRLVSFLNDVQEITSMISYGLKPLGILMGGQLPEYFKNMNVLKRISDIFNVEKLLIGDQTIKNTICYDSKLSKLLQPTINKVMESKLRMFSTSINLNVEIPIAANYQGIVNQLVNKYTDTPLMHNNTILMNTDKLNKYIDVAAAITNIQLFVPQTQSNIPSDFNENGWLQGTVVGYVISECDIQASQLRKLLLNDISTTLLIRMEGLVSEDNTKTYLPQRVLIEFKDSVLILQDFIEDKLNEQEIHQRIKQCSEQLCVKQITLLEPLKDKVYKQTIKQPQQPQQQPQPQAPDVQQLQNKSIDSPNILRSKLISEYYLMGGIVVLLLAIYMGMKL